MDTLKINEIFYSIQGEGLLTGKPTTFVRTTYCNLRCRWCDTGYAFWKGILMTVDEILGKIQTYPTQYVCLTGGEPLAQRPIYYLMGLLLNKKYKVSIETGGGFSISEIPKGVVTTLDVKCPDSGESESMVWDNFNHLKPNDQIKFVIASHKDFLWASNLVRSKSLETLCPVFFSPAQGKISPKQLAEWILETSPPVTLQLQMHKQIWGNARGV